MTKVTNHTDTDATALVPGEAPAVVPAGESIEVDAVLFDVATWPIEVWTVGGSGITADEVEDKPAPKKRTTGK